MALSLTRAGLLLWALPGLCGPALAQEDPGPPPPQEVAEDTAEPSQPEPEPAADTRSRDPLRILLAEIDRLHDVLDAKRMEMAEMQLEVLETRRELQELRQFIQDNEVLGRDFEQYRAVKAVAERDARRRQAEEARERRAIEKAERAAQMQAAKAERDRNQAEFNRLKRYREAGFSPLGFDVYLADISFNYSATDGGAPARIDWDFRMGHYVRLYPFAAGREVDFTAMTISGSVLNASAEVRNIGVAVAFFDENGSQVGGEIIQINNARPNVPYPFTSTVAMALNRAFTSASTYVVYADPVEPADPRRPSN
jgi:multidrug efflux pump subunit AcrA (membrane-fusion protein)